MWYIILALVLIAFSVLGLSKCNFPSSKNNGILVERPDSTQLIINGTDTIKGAYARDDIKKMLEELAKAPAPEKIEERGAMCYKMAAAPDTAEYVCPVCGEKTLWERGMAETVDRELNYCRSSVKSLQNSGLYIKLDETEFCKKCSPDVEEPQICLITQYYGESKENRTEGIRNADLQMVIEFLAGKTIHNDFYDSQSPLVNYIDRIQELLGVEIITK